MAAMYQQQQTYPSYQQGQQWQSSLQYGRPQQPQSQPIGWNEPPSTYEPPLPPRPQQYQQYQNSQYPPEKPNLVRKNSLEAAAEAAQANGELQPTNSQSSTPQAPKKKSNAVKLNRVINRISKPINKFVEKQGCESFHPAELDHEVEKAARILRAFCLDGFMAEEKEEKPASSSASTCSSQDKAAKDKGPNHGRQRKALRRIPKEAIENCRGLAIFTAMRWGWQIGGGGGCGILIRHLPDGSWSAPSGIHMMNVTGGLVAGLDVFDCVAVINNEEAMQSFQKVRGTIGGEVAATVGPMGAGAMADVALSKDKKLTPPVWTYTKNRGLYVGAHVDGTMFIERTNENPRFYGKEGIRHAEVLSGTIKPPPGTCKALYATLAAIEGKEYHEEDLPPPYEAVMKDEKH